MKIPVFTVDAFTNLPFKGNPAAVCPLLCELQDELYQKIAAEMNLSETAFITRLNPADDFSSENINSTLVFETMSGELHVRQKGDSIVMDFPLNKPVPQVADDFKEVIKAAVGDHPVQEVCLCPTTKKLMVRLDDTCDRSVLTSLQPNAAALLASESSGRVKGVIVTMLGAPQCQPGYDFYSRNFSPWNGIPEDPVTGSSHTVLASYWSEKLGKKIMLAYQCSSRGGELQLEVRDDGRLDITGQAVTILEGTLFL
ncbi:phenazine biosynthesis-like domain-containing protein isoform X2 [Osmerus mordax]|uniref:phenazine biosynthesis-like domain-containing protein isoform X2 n=1 Tax=Osmerus mordax TaxID=8014 RepID=UPI00350F014B